MSDWWFVLIAVGLNFSVWGLIGCCRLLDNAVALPFIRLLRRVSVAVRARFGRTGQPAVHRSGSELPRHRISISDVAVLMAAHNEELVIAASLARLTQLIPTENVHVVSDGSTDATVSLARAAGARVVETPENAGKAAALTFALEHFELLERFSAVMVLDADTQLDAHYFEAALPLFDDPLVVAVAGCAQTRWQRGLGVIGTVLVSHRQRVYVLTQFLMKYGQTWRGISATHIVPGFASVYLSTALKHIDINPRGLVIEDFNMTFEVQNQRLGRIAFSPQAKAYTQDPANYRDYVRQTRRWALGLWQTVRRSRPQRPVFVMSLSLTLLELITSSLIFVTLPFILLLLAVVRVDPGVSSTPALGLVCAAVAGHVGFRDIGLGILAPDYLLTCTVAILERRPRFLLAGLFFVPMKMTDAAIALYTLPRAWLDRSTGQWSSPSRRIMQPGEETEVA